LLRRNGNGEAFSVEHQAAEADHRPLSLSQRQADLLQRMAQVCREANEQVARTQEMLRTVRHS
jgi:dihydroxyacetone kinase-like predicted kinase